MDSDADAQAPECDPVTDSLHCMTTGVFVDSVGGQDANDGTQSSPVKTVAKALALAKSQSKPSVFLCKGSYGAVTLNTASTAATSLYGGFDCNTWAYDQSNKTLIASPDGTPALRITGFADSIVISDLSFESKDAGNPGDSSIAIFIANSDVTLRRVTATAGVGASGVTPGAPPTNLVTKTAAAAVDATGAGPTECDCTNGSKSIGGVGGNGGNNPMGGQAGSSNPSAASPRNNGGAGYTADNGTCIPGSYGVNASLGGSGGAGAASWGTLDADGWHPADGNPGTAGNPGQGGGGGGGGQSTTGGGGGSGACGDCGGAGGLGGGGGGASIAVASYMSTVTITGGSFTSSAGGVGGKGGDGESGGQGPIGGGFADDPNHGCTGGTGGSGAGGGGGGGGAGGLSVSILWLGGTMTRDDSTLVMPGAGGVSGLGGTFGLGGNTGTAAPPGADNATAGRVGISQTMLDLTPDGGS